MLNAEGEETWVVRTGEAVAIRIRFVAEDDCAAPVFAIDIHRYDGVFIGSINNFDTHPATLSITRGEGMIELRLARV